MELQACLKKPKFKMLSLTMSYIPTDPLIIFLSCILIVVVIIDIRLRKIPYLLTFPTMILGVIYHCIKFGWDGLFFSLGGLAIGIAIFFILYLMGGMGAGDVKLMGAVGAIIGSKGILLTALFSAIVGGVYALIVLSFNFAYLKDLIRRSSIAVKSYFLTKQIIPVPADNALEKPKLCYGVAIALGTFSYLILEAYGCNPI